MPTSGSACRDDDLRALFAKIGEQRRELLAFAYFDHRGRLLGMRHSSSIQIGAFRLPLRDVTRDAMRLNAALVAMAHNHPSGDPQPSRADLTATRRLATGLAALDVRLIEHLVLARAGRSFSLRSAGLI